MASLWNTRNLTMADAPNPFQLPNITKFKIALCQLSVSSDKNQNLDRASRSIRFSVEQGAKLLVLPEMWNCPNSSDYFAKYAEDFDNRDASPTLSMLSEAACCHGITIIGGSLPEWDHGRLYNTCCIFGPDGKLKAKHRKIHLFDIDIPGEISFKESDTFTAGDQPTIVDTEVGRIGIGICHDIRFPELAALYRKRGVDIICYPGAFNMSTGELFWELVQRARAVDNQLFVATCSPSRNSTGSYTTWGHSTLVGPSGEIIVTSGHEETTVIAEIDYSNIQLQRKSLPLDDQRREDIYKCIDLLKRLLQFPGDNLRYAHYLFDQIPKCRNQFLWTSLIHSHVLHDHFGQSITLYAKMHRVGVSPSGFTFSSVLNACARVPALFEGKQVHARVVQYGFLGNKIVQTALLHMYAKCGLVLDARDIFDRMDDKDLVAWTAMVCGYSKMGLMGEARWLFDNMEQRNAVSWTTMVAGYANNGDMETAKELYERMVEKDSVAWVAMIAGYGKCGNVLEAKIVFEETQMADASCWAAMVACYAQNCYAKEAIEMYKKMREEKVTVNEVAMVGAISACTQLGDNEVAATLAKHVEEGC
ncbi:unnamed protein product [Prunus brigantina]